MNILKTLLGESFFSPRMEHWEFVSRRVTLPPSMDDMVLSNVNTKCFDARWSVYICNGLLFQFVLVLNESRAFEWQCRPPGYLVLGGTVYSRSHELQLSVISERNCSNSMQ